MCVSQRLEIETGISNIYIELVNLLNGVFIMKHIKTDLLIDYSRYSKVSLETPRFLALKGNNT
ncbi:hypothetical protein X777_06863 [Ooceraea biroi]|uniref:Uncharacterized protein n=1 Tax=Ooceraea biroi TaxID=2015173 RepID=A0A026WFJ8_OOCBI|nr:hypothetical protein X777_06863 [Ooceraea biroi]